MIAPGSGSAVILDAVTRPDRGSRSNGADNVDPLQTIVFIGTKVTLIGSLLRGNAQHRARGRKPLSQARFNTKRGENQGFSPTVDVESDLRFLLQIGLNIAKVSYGARAALE